MKNNDKLFKEMAEKYQDYQGANLKEQLKEIEKSNMYDITPRLDKKVEKAIKSKKSNRLLRNLSLVAACLALIIAAPLILNQLQTDIAPSYTDSAAEGDSSSATETDAPEDKAPPLEDAPAMSDDTSEKIYDLIPLSFTPPDNFVLEDTTQDRGKTVYSFSNTKLDDVVVTLEMSDGSAFGDQFTPLEINSHSVYAVSESTYNLLAFDIGDIRYTLSSKYDLNTLVDFSEGVLI